MTWVVYSLLANSAWVSVTRKRLTLAGSRLRRIGNLSKLSRATRRLVTTGAVPAALWGVEGTGVSPTTARPAGFRFWNPVCWQVCYHRGGFSIWTWV